VRYSGSGYAHSYSYSQVIYKLAVSRLYNDKTEEIWDALKRNPAVAVPVVLARLKVRPSLAVAGR
jgi:histone deacetylase complex regulatory component SIN3